jgi:hypothetical protein
MTPLAAGHGDEAVHGENRLERLPETLRRDRRGGAHGDLRAHPRVDDDVLVGRHLHRLDDLRDVRILEVQGDARFIVALRLRRGEGGWLRR